MPGRIDVALSWLVSRLHSWSHHEEGLLLPPSALVCHIPRAECGIEVSFGKSNFNIFLYYLCAPHADGVFLLFFPPYSGCLFLETAAGAWSFLKGLEGHNWIAVQKSLRMFLSVLTVLCALLPMCPLWVCLSCKTGIPSLRHVKNFLSFRKSWFCSGVLLLGSFFSSSVTQLCFESKSSAKIKVQYLRKRNQKKSNVSVMR